MQDPNASRPAEAPAGKPAAKRPVRKGTPPQPDNTLGAIGVAQNGTEAKNAKEKPAKAPSKERTEPLNFRVTADFRRAFKRASAAHDCKKVELLELIFNEWSTRNPA